MLVGALFPCRAGARPAAQFERQASTVTGEMLGRADERRRDAIIVRQQAAIDGEGGRHERLPEESAAHMMQGQQPADAARMAHGGKDERGIGSAFLHRQQPGRAVKGRAIRMGHHIGVHRPCLRRIGQVHQRDEGCDSLPHRQDARAASASASASTRVQAKSRVKRRSLAAMTERLL